jgi:hypothetical protein
MARPSVGSARHYFAEQLPIGTVEFAIACPLALESDEMADFTTLLNSATNVPVCRLPPRRQDSGLATAFIRHQAEARDVQVEKAR